MAGAKKKTHKTKRKSKAQIDREKKQDNLLENLRSGMSIDAACSQANVGRQTHYDWIEKDEAYAQEVECAIGYSEAIMLVRLDRCIDDKMDWRGWAWRLSKRFPDKYGDLKTLDLNVSKQSDGSSEVMAMLKQIEALHGDNETTSPPAGVESGEAESVQPSEN